MQPTFALHGAEIPVSRLERAWLFPPFDLLLAYSRSHPMCSIYHTFEHFLEKLSVNFFIANIENMLVSFIFSSFVNVDIRKLLPKSMNRPCHCTINTFSA